MLEMEESFRPDKGEAATILLVDDEQNILSALKRLFRRQGYEVLVADGGAAGLQIMEKEKVDVVISDMRMPNMDGAQFLSKVAEQWPDTVRILLTGYADLSSTVAAINEGSIYKYLSKPWDETDLLISVQRALESRHLDQERRRLEQLTKDQNMALRTMNACLEEQVESRTEELQKAIDKLRYTHDAARRGYLSTIKVFAGVLEMREGSVHGHSRKVTEIVSKLAPALGMKHAEVQTLVMASLLHDIGKIGLPDTVLATPFEQMNEPQRLAYMEHPQIAATLLMSLEPIKAAVPIIHSHHELFDGSGFPQGTRGEEIPLGARVLAVVNDYDGLQRGMLTTQKMSQEQAIDYLLEHRGSRYDPAVVDRFIQVLESGALDENKPTSISSHQLEPGMVMARNLESKNGVVLVPKGKEIDEAVIEMILTLEKATDTRFKLYVRHPD